jgi:hypothetical protein
LFPGTREIPDAQDIDDPIDFFIARYRPGRGTEFSRDRVQDKFQVVDRVDGVIVQRGVVARISQVPVFHVKVAVALGRRRVIFSIHHHGKPDRSQLFRRYFHGDDRRDTFKKRHPFFERRRSAPGRGMLSRAIRCPRSRDRSGISFINGVVTGVVV